KARVRVVREAPDLLTRPSEIQAAQASILELAPPVVTGQYDGNGTVTAISAFAACPRKYYLGHYLGFDGRIRKAADLEVEDDKPVDLSAGEFGTQVHALLAGSPVADPAPEAQKLAAVFRQSALGRRAAQATRVAREA